MTFPRAVIFFAVALAGALFVLSAAAPGVTKTEPTIEKTVEKVKEFVEKTVENSADASKASEEKSADKSVASTTVAPSFTIIAVNSDEKSGLPPGTAFIDDKLAAESVAAADTPEVEEAHEPVNANEKQSRLAEVKEEASETAGVISDKIANAAGSVKDVTSNAAGQIGDAANFASDTAKNVANIVQNGASSAAAAGWALLLVFAALSAAVAL